jgi:hypothetical protein
MPTGPKEIEAKMKKMLNAWEEIAPEKSFAGTTLDQFRTVVTRAQTARARIADLEDQMLQAINERENADEAFNTKAQQVVNGVLADPTAGPDSALYEGFGYTRKSERKSGLTRKGGSSKGSATPPTKP